jgi:Zn-dependent protease
MALGWGLLLKIAFGLAPDNPAAAWLMFGGAAGVFVNVIFCVLNPIPLPPLDGGRILVSLLPQRLAWRFAAIERYGFFILLALLFTGILGMILTPLVSLMLSAVAAVLAIPEAALYQIINLMQ